MKFTEEPLAMPCAGESLAGVLAVPEHPGDVGVVIVVGGPQYRVGSHRQFVLLARHLATRGITALRFDFRGMGDSTGAKRSFEETAADVHCAVDALVAAVPAVREVALWGLCDGASAALLYLEECEDPRVRALCLVNPWVRSPQSLARTHMGRHYPRRLRDSAFWFRVLTGRVKFQAVAGLWSNVKLLLSARRQDSVDPLRPFQRRMADAWRRFPGRILLLLSENDYTADEFRSVLAGDPDWAGAQAHTGLVRLDLRGADHTMSDRAASESAERQISSWLLRSPPASPAPRQS